MLDMLFGKFDTLLELPEFKGFIYKLDTIGDAYIVVANLSSNCATDHADIMLRFASAMLTCTASVIMYQVGANAFFLIRGTDASRSSSFLMFFFSAVLWSRGLRKKNVLPLSFCAH